MLTTPPRLMCWLLVLVIAASALQADEPPKNPAPADPEAEYFETAWEHLAKSDPYCSHALLQFAAKPQAAVEFLKPRLLPLTIEADEVRSLLTDLGNDNEEVWKPAAEELEYFDPRLAIDLETLMEEVREFPARQRMVWILSRGGSLANATIEDNPIELRKTGDMSYNFFSGNGSWWAEHLVERLSSGSGWGNPKPKWTRAIRAIVLLEHIGTPEAVAIVEAMATGHPDAEPTRVAQGVLEARKVKEQERAAEAKK